MFLGLEYGMEGVDVLKPMLGCEGTVEDGMGLGVMPRSVEGVVRAEA